MEGFINHYSKWSLEDDIRKFAEANLERASYTPLGEQYKTMYRTILDILNDMESSPIEKNIYDPIKLYDFYKHKPLMQGLMTTFRTYTVNGMYYGIASVADCRNLALAVLGYLDMVHHLKDYTDYQYMHCEFLFPDGREATPWDLIKDYNFEIMEDLFNTLTKRLDVPV